MNDLDQQLLEKMIREVMLSMAKGESNSINTVTKICGTTTKEDYPLSKKKADVVKSATGKKLDEFTMENVMNGTIGAADCRIAPETLEMQAQVAESVNRHSFARNLRRAAELISIPDDRILEIYNYLRPYRATKAELLEIADELEHKYAAKVNAAFVREAAELYEKRDRLRKD